MTTADHDGCSLAELTFAFGSRALSPVTALERCLTRIDECNGRLNAFVEIDRPRAMQAARASAQRWAEGAPLGPVDGVPFTVKNNLLVEGYPVRRGSRITGGRRRGDRERAGCPALSRVGRGFCRPDDDA